MNITTTNEFIWTGNTRSNRFTQASIAIGLLGQTELALTSLLEQTLLFRMGLPRRTEQVLTDL